MIALDPVKVPLPSVSSQPSSSIPTPQQIPPPSAPSEEKKINVSEESMFDLLNSSHAPEQKTATSSELNEDDEPPLL